MKNMSSFFPNNITFFVRFYTSRRAGKNNKIMYENILVLKKLCYTLCDLHIILRRDPVKPEDPLGLDLFIVEMES